MFKNFNHPKIRGVLDSPKIRKYAIRALIAFVAVGLLGFFVLPPLIKPVLAEKLGLALHRQVTIDSMSINPYALSVTLDGVTILEPESKAKFASFDRLYLNLESSSLFRGGPVLGEIRWVKPAFRIVRYPDKRYNFSDLLDEFMAKPRNDDPTPPFSLNNIQLTGGEVEFDDRLVDEKHVVSDINLSLPFISSMAYATDSNVEPSFSAVVNGAPLVIKGKSKPFAKSLESEVELDLGKLQLAKYIDYVPLELPIKVVSGDLDAKLKLLFRQEDGKAPTLLLSGTAAIDSLKVNHTSTTPLVAVKHLALDIGSFDIFGHTLAIDRIAVDTPEIHARVSHDGAINWIEFFRKKREADPAKPLRVEKPESSTPFAWSIGEAKVTGGALHWLDESNDKPFEASIDDIEFDLSKLDGQGTTPVLFDLSWRLTAEEWLKVDRFTVTGGQLNLATREVLAGDVKARGVRSLLRRKTDGKIDWLKPPTLRAVETSQKDTATPWKITIARYVGESFAVRFEDQAVSPMAVQSIEDLGFEVENLSTVPGQMATMTAHFKLNGKGDLALNGSLQPFPLDAALNVDIKTVELLPLQPYFSERLNIAITRGQVSASGSLQLRQEATGNKGGASVLNGGFTGLATIGDLNAVDKLNSADFLRWKSLYFGKVDVRLNPVAVSIGEVALSDFYSRLIVSPEGKLNLMQIVRKEGTAAVAVVPQTVDENAQPEPQPADGGKAVSSVSPSAAESEPSLPIKIEKITLQGGQVRFSDNFVKPNYSANLNKIGGHLTGLSSVPGTVANLELRGSYDNVSPLTVSARINPLSAKPYLDLQAEIKGIELTSLSSYASKYAGYMIEKGKLSLSVKYTIKNDQLEAENQIFLDQLTFGEAVDSPDAVKLPVTLAVALLKNRKGEIDLNLPISGSLNDPQFSIGGLVAKVIFGAIAKAVTSPFALLGSMFGGGEELSNVEFDYGRAVISSAAQKRLESLSKALIDKPELRLEIEGQVDPDPDREGLKRARIERKVKRLKREAVSGSGGDSSQAEADMPAKPDLEDEVATAEYATLLERVYRAEKFAKPRNMIGMVKSLPVEEMEKLMLANSVVNDDDLRNLGDRRAKAVRDWLVAHEVPPERLFLLPSNLVPAKDKAGPDDKTKNSRVDFSLK